MTRNDLSQYRKMGKEIALLEEQLFRQEAELQRVKGLDFVKGSSVEFPYICHNIFVGGGGPSLVPAVRMTVQRLQQTIKARHQEMRHLEKYIAGIQDSEIRQIFILRYMGPELSWEQIARKMGPGISGESVRAQHNRYLGLKI